MGKFLKNCVLFVAIFGACSSATGMQNAIFMPDEVINGRRVFTPAGTRLDASVMFPILRFVSGTATELAYFRTSYCIGSNSMTPSNAQLNACMHELMKNGFRFVSITGTCIDEEDQLYTYVDYKTMLFNLWQLQNQIMQQACNIEVLNADNARLREEAAQFRSEIMQLQGVMMRLLETSNEMH